MWLGSGAPLAWGAGARASRFALLERWCGGTEKASIRGSGSPEGPNWTATDLRSCFLRLALPW